MFHTGRTVVFESFVCFVVSILGCGRGSQRGIRCYRSLIVARIDYNTGVSRLFFGNFNFEYDLAAASGTLALRNSRQGRAAGLVGSDRDWVWVSIAQAGDVVLAKAEIAAADFSQLAELGLPIPRFVKSACQAAHSPSARLVPWGWTDGVRAIGKVRGWECVAPPMEVVRQVNSRLFRFELEREYDIGLDGAAVTSSLDELDAVLQRRGNTPRGWLLKANFGMSGRESRRGRGTHLDDNTRNWAQRRLHSAGPIIFEPLVERVAEAGIQMEIPQTGEPALIGVTPLLVDRSGVYRGSRFACPGSEIATWEIAAWRPAVETGLRLAKRLQGLGYFGPLGVDAMQYRDEAGDSRMRPLQDLNARYTMGRLALGFCRILRADWCGSWLHFGAKNLFSYFTTKLRMAEKEGADKIAACLQSLKNALTGAAEEAGAEVFIQEINHQAGWEFVPQPLDTAITVFSPRKNYDFFPDPKMGWYETVGDRLEVVKLPVNPHAMLIEPCAGLLANELKKRLHHHAGTSDA